MTFHELSSFVYAIMDRVRRNNTSSCMHLLTRYDTNNTLEANDGYEKAHRAVLASISLVFVTKFILRVFAGMDPEIAAKRFPDNSAEYSPQVASIMQIPHMIKFMVPKYEEVIPIRLGF